MRARLRERSALSSGAPLSGAVFAHPHSARILDAVLMGLLVYRLPAPFVPGDVPLAQLAVLALLAICLFRRPTRSLGRVRWYPLLSIALLALVAVSSLVNQVDFTRRGANIALLLVMAGFLASGRIDVASALKGIGVALAANAVLFFTGIAPSFYEGALTGFVQDKNVAGLMYAVAALLVSATTERRWLRVTILVLGGLAVIVTDSRTSMAAYACGLIWLAVSPKLGLLLRAVIGLGIYLLFIWAEANLAALGDYRIDRAGSDALRERIHDASRLTVETTPWFGSGLGRATTEVNGITWFFHDAYLALVAEGGLILLIGMLVIYVGAGFAPFARVSDSYARHAVGGATVVLLLCATQLGEVFFAPIGLVAVGVGLALIAQEPGRTNLTVSGPRRRQARH